MNNYKEIKLKEMIDQLKEYRRDAQYKIELWRNVKKATKKDGSPFSALSKNFVNAEISPVSYSIRPDFEIIVSGHIDGVYTRDYFSIYPCVNTYKKPVSDERIIKETLINPYFKMNIDEIFETINDRILYYEKHIKELNTQIDNAERVYTEFTEAIDNAVNKLKADAGVNTSLYFACRKYMETAY